MSDLITHLREIACSGHPIGDEAADEIESLRARIAELESPGPRGAETGPDQETYLLNLHQQLRDSRARVVELETENTILRRIAYPYSHSSINHDLSDTESWLHRNDRAMIQTKEKP